MIEFLLPHLSNLDIAFRSQILDILIRRIPDTFSNPAQYINLLQILNLKGDY
jgi:hypothetical protein